MAVTQQLPNPTLRARLFGARCIPMLTDEALYEQTGVRIAFTTREGGVSQPPYASLNLGSHVGDNSADVLENRARVLQALGAASDSVVVPNQIHGHELVEVESADSEALEHARMLAAKGADGLVVTCAEVSALLCFADCVPVIIVAPNGTFAVVHAGWRGVMPNIAPYALVDLAKRACASSALFDAASDAVSGTASDALSDTPDEAAFMQACNIYIGPHICESCFETSEELAHQFADTFSSACVPDNRHVNLTEALKISLVKAGADSSRIVDAHACTQECVDTYFSYRAEGGMCGRHGAIAFKKEL